MKQVIMTKGLPASGKSTWAKDLITKHPGVYKRVNKDDLRAMLDVSKWSGSNEKFVLKIRDEIILKSLDEGKHVIVDDTNLHEKHETHIHDLIKGKAELRIKDFTDVDLDTCLKRDAKREASVGKKVIMRMYNQYLRPEPVKYKFTPGRSICIICDIDGTLAKMVSRGPFEWDKVDQDEVNEPVRHIIERYTMFDSAYKIIMLSGRDGSSRELTEKWLEENGILYHHLYMRTAGDCRKDSIVKRELYDKYIAKTYNVLFVLDDRNQVVDMWRNELGLTCLQVAEGDF